MGTPRKPDEGEVWELIRGFTGFRISNFGKIVDMADAEIEPYFDEEANEMFVKMEQWGNYYHGPVWGVVLRAFYRGNFGGVVGFHTGDDPRNNNLEDLRFASKDEKSGEWAPVRYRTEFGLRHIDRRLGPPIRIIETGEVFASAHEVARHISGDAANVVACLRGRLISHKGFHFEYLP